MEFIRENQLNLMSVLSGVCSAILAFTYVIKFQNKKVKNYLLVMEAAALVALIADRYAYCYRGDTSTLGYWMVRISNFAVFYALFVANGYFSFYVKNVFLQNGSSLNKICRLDVAFMAAVIGRILLIVTQFTGLYYTFDENNLYVRSSGYIVCILFHFISIVLQMSFIIQHYSEFSKRIGVSLLLYGILPIVSAIFQFFFYGISLNTFSLAIAAIGLFAFALSDLNFSLEEAKRREDKMEAEYRDNMERLFEQTVGVLSGSIDAKDKYTQGHSQRVAQYSKKLAKLMGLSKGQQREIYFSALLHDVGKIGINDAIINKEGKLTSEEFGEIKKHPKIGSDILEKITLFPALKNGALYHHERYDGTGYPNGLKGDDIPLYARIISVADAYDAMSSKRSYRGVIPQQHVREQMVMGMGTQFDPEIATKMVELIDQDFAYSMREKYEASVVAEKSEFKFADYLSDASNSIWIVAVPTTIRLKSVTYDKKRDVFSMPSLVVFDSLDAKIHTTDAAKKEMHFLEYLTIRADGEVKRGEIRQIKITETIKKECNQEIFRKACEDGIEIEYSMTRFKDHLRIILKNPFKEIEYIVAVQDDIRFSHGAITGENCDVEILSVEKAEKMVEPDDIPRIAPLLSYADGPAGDIPNIQVPAWRVVHSQEILLKERNIITFHALSLPTSRLIWHCPFVVVFGADDNKFHGENFQEYVLIRMDGECWSESNLVKCSSYVNRNLEFDNWNTWKENNKKGVDCNISIIRTGNKLLIKTDNSGIVCISNAELPESVKDLCVVLTGDQCAITNIKIQ